MILRTCNLEEFMSRTNGYTLICFGAGKLLSEFCDIFQDFMFERRIAFIVDNNPALWGTKTNLNGIEIEIKQPDAVLTSITKDAIVLITCGGPCGLEVFESLNTKPELAVNEFYFASFVRECQRDSMSDNANKVPEGFRMNLNPVIPKKIHYCWVGGNPIPEKNRKCIDSWKRFCPNYEIIEWNESNYDFTKNRYMREAYEARKWGFVPDYARLDIIYTHGGIYLDVDVEIIRPLDELLYNDAFCGFENMQHIAFGLGFGSKDNFPLFKEMCDFYNNISFTKEDGSLNLIASPVLQTQFLLKHGLKQEGGFQVLEGLAVYPVEYFAPLSLVTKILRKTSNTFSIHWFDGSWLSEEWRKSNDVYAKLFASALENEKSKGE